MWPRISTLRTTRKGREKGRANRIIGKKIQILREQDLSYAQRERKTSGASNNWEEKKEHVNNSEIVLTVNSTINTAIFVYE